MGWDRTGSMFAAAEIIATSNRNDTITACLGAQSFLNGLF